MKAGWQLKKLSEVCIVERGSSPRPIKEYFTTDSDGVNWIKISDTEDGGRYVYSTAQKITPQGAKQSRFVKEGDFILTNSMSFGRPYIMKTSGYIHDGWFVLRLKDFVNADYFYHLLSSDLVQSQFKHLASGAIVQNISGDLVKMAILPIPPLPEQHRIVAILDEAFEAIATAKANAEKNLQNARAVFESYLESVFAERGPGWVEKPMGDICDFLNGFAFKSGDVVAKSQTQLVRIGNLYGSQLDLNRNPVFYSDNFATDHSRYLLGDGVIIMSLTGTTGKEDYGFAVRIPECSHALLMNQRIMKFDAIRHDIVDDGYLLHYLRSRCFLNILYSTANGTRQANLSSVTMKMLPVPLGALKEQKQLAVKLDELSDQTQSLTQIYQRKLSALDELKKSLLHQAFSGAL